jgi:hypothetical protein
MPLTQLKIAPTGMRLHEWIALERGYFHSHGIEPIVRWDIVSGIMSSWRGKAYRERPQDLPFVGTAEPVDVINHCAWGSVCNAGAGLGKFVAEVSSAGGLGILSASWLSRAEQQAEVEAIRRVTDRPFGLNHLLCFLDDERFTASLGLRPRVISTAWPWSAQDLSLYFERAHAQGALVFHMVSSVAEAVRAVEANADVIVAQGTIVIVREIVDQAQGIIADRLHGLLIEPARAAR